MVFAFAGDSTTTKTAFFALADFALAAFADFPAFVDLLVFEVFFVTFFSTDFSSVSTVPLLFSSVAIAIHLKN